MLTISRRAHSLILIDVGETLTFMAPFNPDLGDFLLSLRKQGYRDVVATETTTKKYARHYLSFTQLPERLWPNIYGPLIKTEPDIWKGVAAEFRYAPEDCIVIDNLEPNIAAAQKAGMKGILYQWKDQYGEAVYRVYGDDKITGPIRGRLLVLNELIRSLLPPPEDYFPKQPIHIPSYRSITQEIGLR